MSEVVSFELRAFYNDDIRQGVHGKSGLSCFSPVINIMRHPLWGRNQVNIDDWMSTTGAVLNFCFSYYFNTVTESIKVSV